MGKYSAWKYIPRLRRRDGDLCSICGVRMLFRDPFFRHVPLTSGVRASIDHIKPRALNGQNKMDNFRLTHQLCNQKRAKHEVTEDLRIACKTAILKRYGMLIADVEREHQRNLNRVLRQIAKQIAKEN